MRVLSVFKPQTEIWSKLALLTHLSINAFFHLQFPHSFFLISNFEGLNPRLLWLTMYMHYYLSLIKYSHAHIYLMRLPRKLTWVERVNLQPVDLSNQVDSYNLLTCPSKPLGYWPSQLGVPHQNGSYRLAYWFRLRPCQPDFTYLHTSLMNSYNRIGQLRCIIQLRSTN